MFEKYYSYADFSLMPQYSEVDSRKDVDVSCDVGHLHLKVPIIAANMDTVCGHEMALAMGQLGGLGILHRYQDPDSVISTIKRLKADRVLAVPSIGIKPDDLEMALVYMASGADAICIDVAHAHQKRVFEIAENLIGHKVPLIVGNVITPEAVEDFYSIGVKILKIGVGPGAVCSTRVISGHGIPQLSALMKINELKAIHDDLYLIADGGITSSGDIVKALAAGADAVMLGSLLAGCDECPQVGEEREDGKRVYRGMASLDARSDFVGKINTDNYTPEGISGLVEAKGPVKYVVQQLVGGIQSGCAYSGAKNLAELREFAEFIRVSGNGYKEGTPHLK